MALDGRYGFPPKKFETSTTQALPVLLVVLSTGGRLFQQMQECLSVFDSSQGYTVVGKKLTLYGRMYAYVCIVRSLRREKSEKRPKCPVSYNTFVLQYVIINSSSQSHKK